MSVRNVLLFAVERLGISFAKCDSTQREDWDPIEFPMSFFSGLPWSSDGKEYTMQKAGVQSLC